MPDMPRSNPLNDRLFRARQNAQQVIRFVRGQNRPLIALAKTIHAQMHTRGCYVHAYGHVEGYENIAVEGELRIGIRAPGFQSGKDCTLLLVRGRLEVAGSVSIGRGSRVEIAKGALCRLTNCNLNGASDLVIRHGLEIGSDSAISWGCQIMDDDWHNLDYPGRRARDPRIVLGEHVWVGSHVLIHKGTQIGDGCVVAAGSVISGVFPSGVLIGGNPARIVREDVTWS